MQHCDECNKDFYSDTEFEMDRQSHEFARYMERVMEGAKETAKAIGGLAYEQMAKGVIELMVARNIPFEDAAQLYLDYRAAIGPLANAHHRKIMENKLHGME